MAQQKPEFYSSHVLEPDARLKSITSMGSAVEIDAKIPPHRYYRSGLEMVRMANAYLEEGSLESAFVLYMKFMTLFLEKIRNHPDFPMVTKKEKEINREKLDEVFPKAELLKVRLLDMYKQQYERYLKDEKRKKEESAKAREQLELLKKKKEAERANALSTPRPIPAPPTEHISNLRISPVPNITGELYPNLVALDDEAKAVLVPPKPLQLCVTTPTVNRSNKPANLLSPTITLPNSRLRTVVVPGNLIKQFTSLAQRNTDRNVETCGILAGRLKKDELVISHLLIPQQTGSPDSCDTQREEDLFDFQDQNDLITFGWIHTHPTQTAFLSSVDLHTHCSYQRMMPEAIAIVCAPRYNNNKFFYLTPDYGLDYIANCDRKGFHPHPTEPELYTIANHVKIDAGSSVKLVDLRTSKN
ncbi:JAB_MPN [Nesidiocoris tenuis]|uniref:JAB_MPN n=1 Tax=Nesidiocoris tenuis TaxID=355587 RepID=A0ABN7A5L3_9HEMI|nr:JAB_MPN [Nesidiocoris tenuis]